MASTSRTARYRATSRARGLRSVQIWVPDTRAPGFAEEARRPCLLFNAADEEERIMDWIERVSIFEEYWDGAEGPAQDPNASPEAQDSPG